MLEIAIITLTVLFVSAATRSSLSLAAPLVFAIVVHVFSFEAGICSRILTRTPFRQFGTWSYSIYMVHAPLLEILMYLVRLTERLTGATLRTKIWVAGAGVLVIWLGNNILMVILGLVFLGALIAASSVTFRYIEEPWRHHFNDLTRGMEQRTRQPRVAEQ
jgi:hypothetical protein